MEISPLKQFYNNMVYERTNPVTLYHSDVYYVLNALRAKEWRIQPEKQPPESIRAIAEELTIQDMHKLLYEEGYLPWYEYGIPRWFARKHLRPKKAKRPVLQSSETKD